ncbi:Ig-like domain-containing protein [Methylomarinum vadi]|uniref:Ig-like domain-containing protein n=1 Tax=Methylomarinum vadi TaxID=438855 RepID=UPI00068E90E8|nr:PKD domain-containing protein [Methylomarinum vadi]
MKTRTFNTTLLTASIALALSPLGTAATPAATKHYGKNMPFTIEDLPNSNVKTKLKKLAVNKRQKALNWLHSFTFGDHDLKHLQIDDEGGVLYGDTFDMTELADSAADSTDAPQSIAPADTFKLHSKPGATNVIFIDVDGHTLSGTAWNGGSGSIDTLPFDTDGDNSSFSNMELAQIAEIWHRVAEDFAPFNVDVTTEQPASFGPTTGRILITRNKDASNNDMPYATAGGVAYVNVWGSSSYASYYSPALVYYNNLASFPPYIAEAAAHEMGHNLSLSHDGTSTASYYSGHGSGFVSWAPIMGVGYYNNVTQWSKGEYTDATQTQDDIALIADRLTFRSDDHGNNMSSPTPLYIDINGTIPVTSPETDPYNLAPDNKGIIETRDDVDFFAFDAGAGPLSITVTPAWESFYRSSRRGANLDIQASLYNWDGQIIAESDPLDETDAQIVTTVASGQYLLSISGVGNNVTPYSDYGSLGQYYISGSVVPFSPTTDDTPPNPDPMSWSVAPFAQARDRISMQAATATDDSGAVEYRFICLEGCADSGWQASDQFTATGLQAGTPYSFQVLARDSYGNETNPSISASATTEVNASPQSRDTSIDIQEDNGTTLDLSTLAEDAEGDPLTFSIQSAPLHGTVANNNGIVIYTPQTNFNGSDSFVYQVADNFGGKSSATVTINVIAVNDAPIASAALDNKEGLSVSFSGDGSFDPDKDDVLSFNWDFGDGTISTLASPGHNYNEAGTYTVTLTVTDQAGLSDSASIVMTVIDPNNILPEAPSLTYSVDKIISGRGKDKSVNGTVQLKWSSNSLESYKVWRCEEVTSGKGKNKTTSCIYPETPFATTDTAPFSTPLESNAIHYKVSAHNSNGDSGFSNEVIIAP